MSPEFFENVCRILTRKVDDVLFLILDVRDYTVFSGIVAPLLKELDAFRMTLNTNPVFVMTQILFKEYFAKISYVVDKLVSEKVNFSSSNSCLIQHVAKNIMGVKQKWIEIGRPGGTYKGSWDFEHIKASLIICTSCNFFVTMTLLSNCGTNNGIYLKNYQKICLCSSAQ